jgi:pyruvate/2-oxoglutarate dehydrogenase complex dihydrolipoamide dehydrogenase (E3) component
MQNGTSKAKPDDEQIFLSRVHPEDWENPEPRSGYDFAIVGAGPAGLAAAESAARLGFSVALIERNRVGGNSLNVGSVPSKAIIGAARVYGAMQEAEAFGALVPNASASNLAR